MAPPKHYHAPADGSAAAARDPVEKLITLGRFSNVTRDARFAAYDARSGLTPRNAFMLAYALFKNTGSTVPEPAFERLGRNARQLVAALPDEEAAALRREAKRACARLCLRLARGAGPRANCVLEEICLHAALARLQEPGAWEAMKTAAGTVDSRVLTFDLSALPERKNDGNWGACFKKAFGAEGARRIKMLLKAGPLPSSSNADRSKLTPKGCELSGRGCSDLPPRMHQILSLIQQRSTITAATQQKHRRAGTIAFKASRMEDHASATAPSAPARRSGGVPVAED